MARLPTWTELRLEAVKLLQTQQECNQDVHHLLDRTIPELDRKLAQLNVRPSEPRVISTTTFQRTECKQPKVNKMVQQRVDPQPEVYDHHDSIRNESDLVVVEPMRRTPTPEPERMKPKHNYREKQQEKQHQHRHEIEQPKKKYTKEDLEDLEHLKPLPLTPSAYLRLNRPDMVKNADRRVMYLKKSAERRKFVASTRTNNALDQIRLSSRNSHNNLSIKSTLSHDRSPNYQVKVKLSEREMKRLTAKNYNRLPEVKKQLNEEVTKLMKLQYNKNKREYGRKLLENRRNGVINYPLRPSYEQCSGLGSQDSSFASMSDDRSSDTLRFESY